MVRQIVVGSFTVAWLYVSTPKLYSLSVLQIREGLEGADLSMWNGGDLISHLGALAVSALYITGICHLAQVGLLKGKSAVLSQIQYVLLLIPLLLGGWWGTRFILSFFIKGVPDSLSFLIAVFVIALVGCLVLTSNSLPGLQVIRGKPLRRSEELKRKWRRKKTNGFIPWGAAFVEKRNEALHFILIGNTGAGKSTWLEVMMTKSLAGIGFNPDVRAIVVDAKGDILPFLEALGLGVGEDKPLYVILNPFDQRAARWAMGKDINSPGRAQEFARSLIPEMKGDNRFFTQTAVTLLSAQIVSLQRAKGENWSLRDLINAFSTPAIAQALVQRWHPRPQDFDDYFKVKKGDRNDIFMTVRAELDQYLLIAALWEKAEHEFSISDWERGEYVLVLGSDYEYPDALKRVNSLLFTSIAARLKQLPDNPDRRVWLFIDELVATGKLVSFEQLLQLGRSKSVCMVSSVLNMATFIEEFGENTAKSIWALSRHKALFPMDSDSAKYISETIGKYEGIQTTYTPQVPNAAHPSSSSGLSYKRAERLTVLPQELDERNLLQPGPESGLTGFFSLPGEGIHRHTYSWKEIQKLRPERLEEVIAYNRIDERFVDTIPTPWTEAELKDLQIDSLLKEAGQESPSRSPKSSKGTSRQSISRPVKKKP